MATFKGNDISGMVGPVVFLRLNGQGVIRRAPKERKKNSWSDSQVLHRSKISHLGNFWRQSVPDECKQIFSLAAKEMSAYNLFLRSNLPAFNPDGNGIDPAWLHLSAGKLPLPHKMTAVRLSSDPQKIEVTWENDSLNGLKREKDKLLMIAAFNRKFTFPILTGAIRGQETAVINLPAGIQNINGIYLFFGSENEELYSDSEWFEI